MQQRQFLWQEDLAEGWFSTVAGLSPSLAAMAGAALWMALPVPATRVLQSWYQGLLVNARRTRAITEAVVVFGATCGVVLAHGMWHGSSSGLAIAVVAFSLRRLTQTAWLAWRARGL